MSFNEFKINQHLIKRNRQNFYLYGGTAVVGVVMMVACVILILVFDLSRASLVFTILAIWCGKPTSVALSKAVQARKAYLHMIRNPEG